MKALLAPLISFDVKTPIQAFTDTLPPKLKDAILNHHVMVGMSTDMVIFAKGSPDRKVREMDGQMPFEEWIYGAPPKDVEFVRINGNRVIRVEVAKIGEIAGDLYQDEVEGMMRTDGTPLVAADTHDKRTVQLGDTEAQSRYAGACSAAPPAQPRRDVAAASNKAGDRTGSMKPVQFPKQKPDDEQRHPPTARRLDRAAGINAVSGTSRNQPLRNRSQLQLSRRRMLRSPQRLNQRRMTPASRRASRTSLSPTCCKLGTASPAASSKQLQPR